MSRDAGPPAIRRVAHPLCPACDSSGTVLYESLTDRWFGVPGEWSMRQCAARDCGTLYLDPAPHAEDIPALYRSYYTHSSGGDELGRGLPRLARLAYLARRYGYRPSPAPPLWLGYLLAIVPGRREHLEMSVFDLKHDWRGPLLDVGCGSGRLLRLLQSLGWEAEGIDLDPLAVAVAQAAGQRARIGTLEDGAIAERHYAAVTSNHVIEHVLDPGGFLRHCLRVTRPGGRIAMITPNAKSLGHRLFRARWRGLEPSRHLQVFTPSALAQLAREAGYEDVRVTTSARLAAAICRESLRPETAGLATAHPAGVLIRMGAGLFQIIERFLRLFDAEAGEELLLTARAPQAPPILLR